MLHSKGATSLVLDLRNNTGGFLDQAIRVAEVFLPYGQLILTQKGRNGLRDNTPDHETNQPIRFRSSFSSMRARHQPLRSLPAQCRTTIEL